MLKPTHDEVMDLICDLILPFYGIDRDMLVPDKPKGERREENDAEHSWSVAFLACTLAPHIDKSLDIGLVSQYAVIHDLVEVYAGDTSVWAHDSELQTKESREQKALDELCEKNKHLPWVVNTVRNYEEQKDNESRYVRAIDKYIAMCMRFMDGGEYFHKSGTTKAVFDKKLSVHRMKAASHTGVLEYYEEIRSVYDQHPEHFANGGK